MDNIDSLDNRTGVVIYSRTMIIRLEDEMIDQSSLYITLM